MYALQLADKGLRDAKVLPDPVKPTPTLSDIPIVKAFVIRYPAASDQKIQDFYTAYKLNSAYLTTINQKAAEGDPAALKLIEAHSDKLDDLSGVKDALSTHAKLIRMVYKNPDVPADEKRQVIDTLYSNMIQLAEHGLEEVRLLKEALQP